MKTMTCRQLGGACDEEFHADTFEEIAELSQRHGRKMYEKGDGEHIKAMKKMSEKSKNPEAMKKWMEEKREEFDDLPQDM